MSLLKALFPRKRPPAQYSTVVPDFTEEEAGAVQRSLDAYVAAAGTPPLGQKLVVHQKVTCAMMAHGLRDYVESIVQSVIFNPNDPSKDQLLQKAISAQNKAYSLHGLPIMLYQIAGLYELNGATDSAAKYFMEFIRVQENFSPDKIDKTYLELIGISQSDALSKARRKVADDGNASLFQKADLLGARTVGSYEIAKIIIEDTLKKCEVGLRSNDEISQFTTEVIAFYMYLTIRYASEICGANKRDAFADRYIAAVEKDVIGLMKKAVRLTQ